MKNHVDSLNKLSNLDVTEASKTLGISFSRLLNYITAAQNIIDTYKSLRTEILRHSCMECDGDGWKLEIVGEEKCEKCDGKGSFHIIDEDVCTACDGKGAYVRANYVTCDLCNGAYTFHYPDPNHLTCPKCKGAQWIPTEEALECVWCGGSGIVSETHRLLCVSCGGSGSIKNERFAKCASCGGKGWVEGENVLKDWKMIDFMETSTVDLAKKTGLSQHRIEIIKHHIGMFCAFIDDDYLVDQTLEVI